MLCYGNVSGVRSIVASQWDRTGKGNRLEGKRKRIVCRGFVKIFLRMTMKNLI